MMPNVPKLTPVAWVIAAPTQVTKDDYELVHAGDRCHLQGCNRPFKAGEEVAYTAEIGDKKPVCAAHPQ
jgi:ABC-type transport system involved in Fe-S cluster assembly fused permease/ATPase subunit